MFNYSDLDSLNTLSLVACSVIVSEKIEHVAPVTCVAKQPCYFVILSCWRSDYSCVWMSGKWKKVEPASKGLSDPPPDFSRKIEGNSVRRVAEYVHGRRATIRIQNTTQHRSTHAPYTLTLRKRGDSLEHRLHASSSSKQEYLNTTFFFTWTLTQ